MTVRYRDAGVDLDAGDHLAAHLKNRLGTGLFGGFMPVPALKTYRMPVLVSSIDGVGTKVHLAARCRQIEGLGRDLVHHCVNDIAVHGAVPLFFLDYLAFHHLDPGMAEVLIGSIADACAALDMRLAGGETAEMPLVYPPGHFDMAGAVVGVVEQDEIVDGHAIREGDLLIGLASSGLHTNGFSLVQQLFPDEAYHQFEPALGVTLGEALLTPHRSYVDEIRRLRTTRSVHGLAHITGGGIAGNLSRIVPPGLRAEITLPPAPPVFALIQERGVPTAEMRRVFNMGIGLVAVCDPAVIPGIDPEEFQIIGRITSGSKKDEPNVHGYEGRVYFDDCI